MLKTFIALLHALLMKIIFGHCRILVFFDFLPTGARAGETSFSLVEIESDTMKRSRKLN